MSRIQRSLISLSSNTKYEEKKIVRLILWLLILRVYTKIYSSMHMHYVYSNIQSTTSWRFFFSSCVFFEVDYTCSIPMKTFNGPLINAINQRNKRKKKILQLRSKKKTVRLFHSYVVRRHTLRAIHDGMSNSVTTTKTRDTRRRSRGL